MMASSSLDINVLVTEGTNLGSQVPECKGPARWSVAHSFFRINQDGRGEDGRKDIPSCEDYTRRRIKGGLGTRSLDRVRSDRNMWGPMDQQGKSTLRMTRQSFLKTTALLSLATLRSGQATAAPADTAPGLQSPSQVLEAGNAHFHLNLTVSQGMKVELVHTPSSIALAAGDYSYSFGQPSFAKASSVEEGNTTLVKLVGKVGNGVEIGHKFSVPHDRPWVEEEITLTNRTQHRIALPEGRCGFVLPVKVVGDTIESGLKDFKFTAVPYRREPTGNRAQYADYTLWQVLNEARGSRLRAKSAIQHSDKVVVPNVYEMGIIQTLYPQYASEGWVLTDGRRGFLVSKYSQEGMEWALLDRVPLNEESIGLRWGGYGIFQGDPESGAWLAPQASHRFGVTRITAFEGGITEGFYAFRAEMESRGNGCPAGFNPPVHWNELYDNKLWWLPDNAMDKPENRKKYYTLPDLEEAATKARDIGCEALYLDPGWDTFFASKIWDEPRLGKLQDFTALLRREYSLSLSLAHAFVRLVRSLSVSAGNGSDEPRW